MVIGGRVGVDLYTWELDWLFVVVVEERHFFVNVRNNDPNTVMLVVFWIGIIGYEFSPESASTDLLQRAEQQSRRWCRSQSRNLQQLNLRTSRLACGW